MAASQSGQTFNMAPAAPIPMYGKDERALCFHHELLYEAKVLDSRHTDQNDKKSPYEYKVHYKGWKNTWDDWVPQDRLRKYNDENLELSKNLRQEMNAQRRAAAKPMTATVTRKRDLNTGSARGSEERTAPATAASSRGTKRGREFEGIDKEDEFLRRPSIKIFMPDSLKAILVDDWEKVTRESRLVPLPSKTPVAQFLADYAASEGLKRREGSAEADILEEVIAGVKEYFNKSIGRILLYRFERPQWSDIHAQLNKGTGDLTGKLPTDIYGVEHLCRLFGAYHQSLICEDYLANKFPVSMPDLIAHTNMDSQAVSRLREELHKMTQWLSKNAGNYLSQEYEQPTQDYIDRVK
ncbi:MRG-domain-containing protein [Aureobasidium pullulans]|nr:MRG-domain-containing protein [Aureobasidium pullulans]TIA16682.1 MRG-domain-containing protein [Aureobasidium pullulans]